MKQKEYDAWTEQIKADIAERHTEATFVPQFVMRRDEFSSDAKLLLGVLFTHNENLAVCPTMFQAVIASSLRWTMERIEDALLELEDANYISYDKEHEIMTLDMDLCLKEFIQFDMPNFLYIYSIYNNILSTVFNIEKNNIIKRINTSNVNNVISNVNNVYKNGNNVTDKRVIQKQNVINVNGISEILRKETSKEGLPKRNIARNHYDISTYPEAIPKSFVEMEGFEGKWKEFVQSRVELNKPLTKIAAAKCLNRLASFVRRGFDILPIMDMAVECGWQTFWPPNEDKQAKMESNIDDFLNRRR